MARFSKDGLQVNEVWQYVESSEPKSDSMPSESSSEKKARNKTIKNELKAYAIIVKNIAPLNFHAVLPFEQKHGSGNPNLLWKFLKERFMPKSATRINI